MEIVSDLISELHMVCSNHGAVAKMAFRVSGSRASLLHSRWGQVQQLDHVMLHLVGSRGGGGGRGLHWGLDRLLVLRRGCLKGMITIIQLNLVVVS